MMRKGRLTELKPTINAWFSARGPAIYDGDALANLLTSKRTEWRIPAYLGEWKFISFLLEQTSLAQIDIVSIGGRRASPIVRYGWGPVDPFVLGLTLRKRSYATHSTAMLLHGLTDQLIQTLFITTQQRRGGSSNTLNQESIDRAFSKAQRESNTVYKAFDYRYILIEGTYVDQAELTSLQSPQSDALVRLSGLERTLVDICVRPSYSGGIFQILEAFRRARGSVDTTRLLSITSAHSFTYPYEQAIGFYLEKADYPEEAVAPFRAVVSAYDFYLAYGLVETTYIPQWKLYVPRGFE